MFWLAEVFNGSYSRQEIQRMERWAHRERARMVQDLFFTLGRGAVRLAVSTARMAGRGYGAVRRWQRRRAAVRQLGALSDRTLRDIGLLRADIPSVVNAMLDREHHQQVRADNLRPLVTRRPAGDGATVRDTGEHDWQRAA